MKAISVLKFVGKMFGWAIIFLFIYHLYAFVLQDWFFRRFSHAYNFLWILRCFKSTLES